ncbi:MAG: SDR family oxidoreductase [Desulfobacteraceae bacterium]|nr:MAG: SDR family oxidoreductase [Desulfobacteraceae bacterium]
MQIGGKTALVLGAARGIGRQIARALARRGSRLVLPYWDWPEDAAGMLREFSEMKIDFMACRADLRKPDEVEALFEGIADRYAGLDILVNNIERGGMPIVHGAYTSEQWDLEMETTLKAKWWVVDHAMPLLKSAPEATIVVLSSIAGIVGRSGPAALIFNDGYSAANRAVSSFTEIWARQGAPTVRVNELMLGFFETRHAEKTRGWALLTDKEQREIVDQILLKRTGSLDEIAGAVLFLIEEATYMTGSVLRMDGGFVLGAGRVPPLPGGIDL